MSATHDIRANHEAEKSLLTAIIARPQNLFEAMQQIPPAAFDEDRHRAAYDAALRLVDRRIDVTTRTVVDELRRSGATSDAIGLVESLAGYVPTAFASALIDVQDALVRREVARMAMDAATDSGDIHTPVEDLLSKAEARLSAISSTTAESRPRTFAEVSGDFIDQLEKLRAAPGAVTGLRTGLVSLDYLTTGLHPEDLFILAGRPSMGKSAAALSIAIGAAREGASVAFFSLEMSSADLTRRAYSQLARVPLRKIRTGQVNDAETQDIYRARGERESLPIIFDDTPALSTTQLLGKAFQIRQRHGLDLVIVDYLQLMRPPSRKASRELEVAAISSSLKSLARTLKAPVIALSQLSRAVESRADKRPMLSDLRESGTLEQDADIVGFCYRPEYYGSMIDDAGQSTEGRGWIIIAKQRNGATGDVVCRFDGETIAWLNEAEGRELSPASMRETDRIYHADEEEVF